MRRLQDELALPIVGLFDWNPGGVGVMLAYKQGSIALGLEGYRYSTRLTFSVPSLNHIS